jgi:hypothetical protein
LSGSQIKPPALPEVHDLLTTHPPINRRIMLLYQMAGIPQSVVQGSKVQTFK